jgi:epsilon-lactone hydrolase
VRSTAEEMRRFRRYLHDGALPPEATLDDRRAAEDTWGASIALPAGWAASEVSAGGVLCERVEGLEEAAGRFILYLHGGGFGAGSPGSHRHFVARLARAAGSAALTVGYRRAPESVFPAALEDSLTAYRWLLSQGSSPSSIAIGGDSAGGGLALATALACKREGLPLPACLYLLSPWVDLTQSGGSHTSKAAADPLVTTEGLAAMASAYLSDASPCDPLASPVFGDFAGTCPILVQVGSEEVLLSDSLSVAEVAALAGVEVRLEVWAEMVHVWALFHDQLEDARRALLIAGRWIGRHLAADPSR